MAEFTIYLGNKNYSSWSLRPWLLLKLSGLDFEEVVIPLSEPATRATILRYSPSGRVPALKHGELVVCESLGIAEYLAELCPERQFWPADRTARAEARAAALEMHAGFAALRGYMPMNIRSSFPNRVPTPEVWADIARITTIWRDLRRRYGEKAEGPFLFGGFTVTDAMFAPVVSRFRTYGVALDETCQAYAEAVWTLPAFAEWQQASRDEPMVIDDNEF
jgi:glutathione S-transferase